jgi:hypothetical protein
MKKHNILSKKKNFKKFNTKFCDNKMSFQECELAILRNAVEETEHKQGVKAVESPEIQKILLIVEDFIIHKKLICYGGTAINNILPKYAQFYNREIEIPDYDFYSSNALDDAKELADIYYAAGYKDVEAKAGVHMGTFKVFVNFIPIADITYINKELYSSLLKESILISGIHYAPPDFLRMSMYLELSRPAGDVSRWEKVLKRLSLLNEHYPMKIGKNCHHFNESNSKHIIESDKIHFIVRDILIDQGVIFFGAYAMTLYSNMVYRQNNDKIESNFDVINENPERIATIIKEHLSQEKVKNIKIINHPEVGELIPEHTEISIGNRPILFVYKPIACHNYNKILRGNKEINVASIDTILSFYLSFLYADLPYFNKERLSCISKFLFEIQQKNRIEQRGILKRFSIDCYGKQPTLETMRSEKAEKYKELNKNRQSKEYEMWFLKYVPDKQKQLPKYADSISKKFKEESVKIDKKNSENPEPDDKPIEKEENTEIQKTIQRHKKRKTIKKPKSFMDLFRENRKQQTKKRKPIINQLKNGRF